VVTRRGRWKTRRSFGASGRPLNFIATPQIATTHTPMQPDTLNNAIAAISALVAVIGVIYAIRTFLLSRRTAHAEIESARPTFAFISFGFERPNVAHALSSSTELLDATAARISGTLKNIGARPARNVRTLVLVLRQVAPEKWGTIPFPSAIADDVQPNSEWLLESPTLRLLRPDFKGIDIEDYFDLLHLHWRRV
jgi:hypothetical protein